MRKIDNIEELNKMLNTRFSREYIRNSLKSIGTYEKNLDKIYIHEENEDLFIFNKRKDFYVMDAILKKSCPHSLSIDEDIVVEYVYRRDISDFHDIIRGLDFKELIRRSSMTIRNFKADEELLVLDDSYSDFLLKEIEDNFDHYYGCIPSRSDLSSKIKKNEFLGLMEDENLVGFIEISKSGKKLIIDHILILDSYRAKGYSKRMINGLFSYGNREDFTSIELFVNDDNKAAIRMYESMGFERANIGSIIYRRKKNEG